MVYDLWELTNVVPSSSLAHDWNETVERIYNRDVAKVQVEFRTAYIRLRKKHVHRLRRLSEQLPRQAAERTVAESFAKRVKVTREAGEIHQRREITLAAERLGLESADLATRRRLLLRLTRPSANHVA